MRNPLLRQLTKPKKKGGFLHNHKNSRYAPCQDDEDGDAAGEDTITSEVSPGKPDGKMEQAPVVVAVAEPGVSSPPSPTKKIKKPTHTASPKSILRPSRHETIASTSSNNFSSKPQVVDTIQQPVLLQTPTAAKNPTTTATTAHRDSPPSSPYLSQLSSPTMTPTRDFDNRNERLLEEQCEILEKEVMSLKLQQRAQEEKRANEDAEIIRTMNMMKEYIQQLEEENAQLQAQDQQREDEADLMLQPTQSSLDSLQLSDTTPEPSTAGPTSFVLPALRKRVKHLEMAHDTIVTKFSFQQRRVSLLQQHNTALQAQLEESLEDKQRLETKCQSQQDAFELIDKEDGKSKARLLELQVELDRLHSHISNMEQQQQQLHGGSESPKVLSSALPPNAEPFRARIDELEHQLQKGDQLLQSQQETIVRLQAQLQQQSPPKDSPSLAVRVRELESQKKSVEAKLKLAEKQVQVFASQQPQTSAQTAPVTTPISPIDNKATKRETNESTIQEPIGEAEVEPIPADNKIGGEADTTTIVSTAADKAVCSDQVEELEKEATNSKSCKNGPTEQDNRNIGDSQEVSSQGMRGGDRKGSAPEKDKNGNEGSFSELKAYIEERASKNGQEVNVGDQVGKNSFDGDGSVKDARMEILEQVEIRALSGWREKIRSIRKNNKNSVKSEKVDGVWC